MVLGKIFSLEVKMACEVGSLSLYNVVHDQKGKRRPSRGAQ